MELEVLSLGEEFKNNNVRVCRINNVKKISIYDLITAICGSKNVHDTFKRFSTENPDILEKCSNFKFPGRGQGESPVADTEIAMEIILELPGKRAKQYRSAAAKVLLNYMNPSEEFIKTINDRLDDYESNSTQNNFLVNTEEKVTTLSHRAYNDTHVYVRVRYPDEYIKEIDNKKALTLNIIKFGIAYSLNDRNLTYQKEEGDNGYMLFSFSFNSRFEAEAIEKILKIDFGSITVNGSREYVDSNELAKILKIDFDNTSYESYVNVAEQLFHYIVKLARLLWPERYESRGYIYCMTENVPRFVQMRLKGCLGIEKGPLQTELTFSRMPYIIEENVMLSIDEKKFEKLYISSQKEVVSLNKRLSNLQIKNDELQGKNVIKPTPQEKAQGIMPAMEKLDTRSKGAIISRDIITGHEVIYKSCEKAANSVDYSASALRRTFINKPKQIKGKHFRTTGSEYWIPPKNFKFNPEYTEKNTTNYIKATNVNDKNDYIIFESITAAGEITKYNRRTITDHVDKNTDYKGYFWSKVPFTEMGTWSKTETCIDEHITKNDSSLNDDDDSTDNTENSSESSKKEKIGNIYPVTTQRDLSNTNGQNGRCNGKVIAHNFSTNEEIVYDSITRAAASHDISPHSLGDNFLDKPRQFKGKHFRSFDATKYWQPPQNLKYNPNTFEKKSGGYIISIDENGKRTMYESIKTAFEYNKIKNWRITQYIDTDKKSAGFLWKKAKPEEYETFVDIVSENIETQQEQLSQQVL